MPIGVLTNCMVVLVGGIVGASLRGVVSQRIQELLPVIFGLCAMSIGINAVVGVSAMPPVVLAVILGTVIGDTLRLQDRVTHFFTWLLGKLPLSGERLDMERYILIVAIFCSSGVGVFGALTEGMSGDPGILLSKSVLDFFTAAIFAVTLGIAVSVIALPQLCIFTTLYFAARFVVPLTTPVMLADFTACGGMLTIASGLSMSKIKTFPIVNMVPALVLVMPLSHLWTLLMG